MDLQSRIENRIYFTQVPYGTYMYVSRGHSGGLGRGGVPTPENTALEGAIVWSDGRGFMEFGQRDEEGERIGEWRGVFGGDRYEIFDINALRTRVAALIAGDAELLALLEMEPA